MVLALWPGIAVDMETHMKQLVSKCSRAIRTLRSDPRYFLRKVKPYVFRPKSGTISINGVYFDIDLKLDPAMGNMYFGLYQYEMTNLMKRLLKEGDTFIDVGENVGYISAFALGLVGGSGHVHAFEPVPRYFSRLRALQQNNPGANLHVNAVALGERQGTSKIAITSLQNIGWNTMVPDFMRKDTIKEEIEIPVARLTDYLAEKNVRNLRLVKIDTEGFEFPVMKGFRDYLRQAGELPVIVVEIAPTAYPKLNSTCGEFALFMSELGYAARAIDRTQAVRIEELDRTTDVVFFPKDIA